MTASESICVFTSYSANAEPRAVKHAVALAKACPDGVVEFVDCLPRGSDDPSARLDACASITTEHCYFSYRGSGVPRLVGERARQVLARRIYEWTGYATATTLSIKAELLSRHLGATRATCYVGHNVDCLPALSRLADSGAAVVCDCMEVYAGMEHQSEAERRLVRHYEQICLPKCALVLAASDEIADALVVAYGISRPLVLYNCPPVTELRSVAKRPGFHLYWRNSVVGLGGRGLDDALVALTQLPADVMLHLQGRLPAGPSPLNRRISELGVADRIVIHPPFRPGEAVLAAAEYGVGLCLERDVCVNHRCTVSNKLFDYFMAGLAVVVSDMPSLSRIANKTGGGLVYRNSEPGSLAAAVMRLYNDRDLLQSMQDNNRRFAVSEANEALEMQRFVEAFQRTCKASAQVYRAA